MVSVCICARFEANPKEVHVRAVKRIMRYLVYTPKFGLWYPKCDGTSQVIRPTYSCPCPTDLRQPCRCP
jgi:hypothetical protein